MGNGTGGSQLPRFNQLAAGRALVLRQLAVHRQLLSKHHCGIGEHGRWRGDSADSAGDCDASSIQALTGNVGLSGTAAVGGAVGTNVVAIPLLPESPAAW